MKSDRSLAIALVIVLACLVGGCSASNKAGAPAKSTRTITLAGDVDSGLLQPFAASVEEISRGAMRVELVGYLHTGDPNFELLLIDDVKAGRADVGWVSSRVWHSAGVSSFDVLTAPFLISSYELEARVLESPLVDGISGGVESKGLVTIGILPGPMHYLLGKSKAYLTPADFIGATVGISQSWVADQTFAALGATTEAFSYDAPFQGVDVIGQSIGVIDHSGADATAKHLTANIPLWPESFVLFIERSRFDSLSESERGVLQNAAAQSVREVLRHTLGPDAESGATLCRRGLDIVEASADDAATLRTAVEPVYDELATDPLTKAAMARIIDMRSSVTDLSLPWACSQQPEPSASTVDVTRIDGTWQVCITEEEFLAVNPEDPLGARVNAGCTTMGFHRGVFMESGASAETNSPGTYAIAGDRITIRRANGEEFDFTWSVFDSTLTLKGVAGKISPTPQVLKAWRRLGD